MALDRNLFERCLVKIGPFPVAVVALVIGTALGWATSLNQAQDVRDATLYVRAYAPAFPVREIFKNMNRIGPYLSTTIPTAISIAIGTIQCVESAKRAGDFYPTRESMFADGIGTIVGSLFGSFLGMTSKPFSALDVCDNSVVQLFQPILAIQLTRRWVQGKLTPLSIV